MSDDIKPRLAEVAMADLNPSRQDLLPLSHVSRNGKATYAPNGAFQLGKSKAKHFAGVANKWISAKIDDEESRKMEGLEIPPSRPWDPRADGRVQKKTKGISAPPKLTTSVGSSIPRNRNIQAIPRSHQVQHIGAGQSNIDKNILNRELGLENISSQNQGMTPSAISLSTPGSGSPDAGEHGSYSLSHKTDDIVFPFYKSHCQVTINGQVDNRYVAEVQLTTLDDAKRSFLSLKRQTQILRLDVANLSKVDIKGSVIALKDVKSNEHYQLMFQDTHGAGYFHRCVTKLQNTLPATKGKQQLIDFEITLAGKSSIGPNAVKEDATLITRTPGDNRGLTWTHESGKGGSHSDEISLLDLDMGISDSGAEIKTEILKATSLSNKVTYLQTLVNTILDQVTKGGALHLDEKMEGVGEKILQYCAEKDLFDTDDDEQKEYLLDLIQVMVRIYKRSNQRDREKVVANKPLQDGHQDSSTDTSVHRITYTATEIRQLESQAVSAKARIKELPVIGNVNDQKAAVNVQRQQAGSSPWPDFSKHKDWLNEKPNASPDTSIKTTDKISKIPVIADNAIGGSETAQAAADMAPLNPAARAFTQGLSSSRWATDKSIVFAGKFAGI